MQNLVLEAVFGVSQTWQDSLGGHFGPEKKYLAPPPNSPKFPADTLPAPRPLSPPLRRTPPPPGIFQ